MKEISDKDIKLLGSGHDLCDRYSAEIKTCPNCRQKKERRRFYMGNLESEEKSICNDCRVDIVGKPGAKDDIIWGHSQKDSEIIKCPAIIGLMEERTKS